MRRHDGKKTYAYTPESLLSSVTHAGVNDPTEMTWDADGNRITFTSSQGGTTKFVYDTTAGIPAVIEEVLPSTSSVYYIREPNGSLIARVAGAATSYYHFDALGSTRLLTNASGTVTDTYSYDAWGNTTHDTGSLVQPYQYVGQLGYYTHYQDANLALLQLGVRFYDPALGRFTQVDPLREDLCCYAYVGQNPLGFVDPSGLVKFCIPTSFYRNMVLIKIVWVDTLWNPLPVPDPRPGWPVMFFGVAKYDYYYKGERKWVCFDTHIVCKKPRIIWWEEWRPATRVDRLLVLVNGPLPTGEGTPVDENRP